ncbi:MAG: hypothetical protein GWP19_12525 [Planctomycetia bacterium]|nr:hypothetical protein [Planctomycetia bacterium]
MIKTKIINNKKVYITDKHHYLLIPWSNYRNQIGKSLLLFTLDHHNDWNEPFNSYAYNSDKMAHDKEKAQNELDKIDISVPDTIVDALQKLRYDEHIITAMRIDIFDKVVIISYDSYDDHPIPYEIDKFRESWRPGKSNQNMTVPKRPYTYPDSDIYVPENLCWI